MDREFLDRIDAHMARGNELMGDVRDEMQLNRLSYEHQLDLTRTVIMRSDERYQRAMQRSDEVLERNRKAFERYESVSAALVDAINELRTELGAEVRAQTQAIFKLIDRIDRLNGGTSPA